MSEGRPTPKRGNAGKGRPKGASNKVTREIKEMVLQALDEAGGVEYLKTQAVVSPTAFLGLVGKVLPLQVNADHSGKVHHEVIRRIVGAPK